MLFSVAMDNSPFDKPDFASRFLSRRCAPDSVNRALDEPTLISLAGNVAGKDVLEIGCGYGHIAHRLAAKGASVTAIDASVEMASRAKAMHPHPRIEYQVHDATESLPTGPFSLVVAGMVFHLFPEIDSVLDNIRRVMNAGSCFLFSQRHPMRTADPYGANEGESPAWSIAGYFSEGPREWTWLGEKTVIYHRTTDSVLRAVQRSSFEIDLLVEPMPGESSPKTRKMWENQNVPAILVVRCRAR